MAETDKAIASVRNRAKGKAVFGPVPSRRLGRSLGIDLLPYKTCSMDCIYCECGATTDLTCMRREYYPTESILQEIDEVLTSGCQVDCLTFSGVGEPTLHTGIGRILSYAKEKYPTLRTCLLTNATFLGDPALQRELAPLDLVVPSLDGSNEEELQKIGRPHQQVSLKSLVEALISFRHALPQVTMWLEIFIVPGVNDSEESMIRFCELIRMIQPDRVQLNSLDRPAVVDWVKVPSRDELERLAGRLESVTGVQTEIISRTAKKTESQKVTESEVWLHSFEECSRRILSILSGRPCTAEDLASSLEVFPAERLEQHLRRMEKAGLVSVETGPRGNYYRAV